MEKNKENFAIFEVNDNDLRYEFGKVYDLNILEESIYGDNKIFDVLDGYYDYLDKLGLGRSDKLVMYSPIYQNALVVKVSIFKLTSKTIQYVVETIINTGHGIDIVFNEKCSVSGKDIRSFLYDVMKKYRAIYVHNPFSDRQLPNFPNDLRVIIAKYYELNPHKYGNNE